MKSIRRGAVLVLCVLLGVSSGALAGQAAGAGADGGVPAVTVPNFAALVRRYGAAVVNISVTREVARLGIQLPPGVSPDSPLAPFLARRVIGNREEVSLGSGFIVSGDGVILTNRHVIGDSTTVDVKLTDKREFKGRVIGSDSISDVAVVKIDAHDLPAVVTGDPARIEVGDWVMAIGSPYGFANTVTQGIVSAKSRSLPGESYIPFLQTDVPINPGNSGGPLFDLRGRVIAINSMIYSKTGGYQGLSFAIPIDIALDVKDQLLRSGHVTRGRLGIVAQEVSQSLARSFGLPKPDGALVSSVAPDGPAERAGIHPGDMVLAVNGNALDDSADLLTISARLKPGASADLLVWRAGAAVHVNVTVGALLATTGDARLTGQQRAGIAARVLTPVEQQNAHVDHGLLVEQVSGAASGAGLKAGDIVLAVNRTPVSTLAEFAGQLRQAGENAALLIQRGDTRLYVPMHGD